MRRCTHASVVLLAAALGCSGGDSVGPSEPGPVATIKVTPDSAVLFIGTTVSISVTASDASGRTTVPKNVTYSTSDAGLITVSNVGVVTGVHAGTARVQVTADGVAATARLIVGFGLRSLAAGSTTTCAQGADGMLYCWGDNEFGQLAVAAPFAVAPMIPSGPKLTGVVTNGYSTCGIATDGTAWCYGWNGEGEAGFAPPLAATRRPMEQAASSSQSALAAR